MMNHLSLLIRTIAINAFSNICNNASRFSEIPILQNASEPTD